MSSWRWRYERTDGSEVVDVAVTPGHSEGGNEALASASGEFPSQADAESWIGETWADLLEQGVDAVTLLEDDRVVYGPMGLRPPA